MVVEEVEPVVAVEEVEPEKETADEVVETPEAEESTTTEENSVTEPEAENAFGDDGTHSEDMMMPTDNMTDEDNDDMPWMSVSGASIINLSSTVILIAAMF